MTAATPQQPPFWQFLLLLLLTSPAGWLILGCTAMVLAAASDGIFGTTIVHNIKEAFSRR